MDSRRSFLSYLLCLTLLGVAAQAADMDKLLTGNMEAYSGHAVPMVDIRAEGKEPGHVLPLVYGERFGDAPAVSWPPGGSVDAIIDLRGARVIKTVHVRFTGDISGIELSYSVDEDAWHPMDAVVNTYTDGVTWLEAVDYAAPARFVRLLGTVGDPGLAISSTRIYGAEELSQVDLVDGVYATRAPAVAGTRVGLNVIIANTNSAALKKLKVRVNQGEPNPRALGREKAKALAPHRSRMFTVPWDPVETEPHEIVVKVDWQGNKKPVATSVTVPVVNRRLWFGSAYRWATFEGPTYLNFFTPYRAENNPGQIRIARRRGGLYIRGALAANTGGPKDPEALSDSFIAAMDLSDGISIDEYVSTTPEVAAIEAEGATRARRARPDKVIMPWTTGSQYALEITRDAGDVVLMESYMTIYGPKMYETRFGEQIDALRKYEILDRAILVQGIFGDENRPMSPEDLENSIRFVRHTAPEIPGMGCYGGWIRGPTAAHYDLCDELCYRYFIAPVVTPAGEPTRDGDRLEVTLRNVGGMNAHDVRVAAMDAGTGKELGRSEATDTPAGGVGIATIRLPGGGSTAMPDIRILPSDAYTALQYLSAVNLHRRNRAEEGGIDVQRVGYLSGDPEGTAPVPDDAWHSEDTTPDDSTDDYLPWNRYDPASGAVHPSAVLDLGDSPPRPVSRIQCRGYPHYQDLEQYAAFRKSLRVLESDDNVTYTPVAPGYEEGLGSNKLLVVIDGLQTQARYIKINSTHDDNGKGYWIPKAPDDRDPLYKAGDGGLIGWDVYLED